MTRKQSAPAPIIRAVGYVRISVDREDETSTETQEASVRDYCASRHWDVVEVVVDAGRSAYKSSRENRPGLRKARQLIDAGAANVLVTWKLDRAGRNAEDILRLDRELREVGARFVSVSEGFDTGTPTGKMMLTMLSGLAEMESATKSDRVQVWQDQRRTKGRTPTGPRPFGYRRERNELHIDKDEAAVIRSAARKVLAGKSLRSVVGDLNAAGKVNKDGRPFQRRGLAATLTGPTIAGCREVDGVFVPSTEWRPILDRVTWDKVRSILNDPARRSGPGNARRWLLSGIATCGRCDTTKPMQIKGNNAGPRYTCVECGCSVEAAKADEVVTANLLGLLDRKTWGRLRRGRPTTQSDTSGFDEAMAALVERFTAGDISGEEMGRVADELRRQQEIETTTEHVALPDVPDLAKAWPSFTIEQKRLVVMTATASLSILPAQPGTNRFDDRRIAWVAVD